MLKLLLENVFNDLKKSGHTIKLSKSQGVEADTYHAFRKADKKNDIPASSRFIKKTIDHYNALNEITAMQIIKLINSSGRAFGFKYDIVPVPYDFRWEYDKKGNIFVTNTSAFTKLKKTKKSFLKKVNFDDLSVYAPAQIDNEIKQINTKIAFELIGDNDRHNENAISKKKNGYFIDFGHAGARAHIWLPIDFINKTVKKSSKNKKQLVEIFHFWDHFLSANVEPIINIIDKTGKEMINHLKKNNKNNDAKNLEINFSKYKRSIKKSFKRLNVEIKHYLKGYNA